MGDVNTQEHRRFLERPGDAQQSRARQSFAVASVSVGGRSVCYNSSATMSPDRWQKIEGLYHAALEREPNVREAFLSEASGGDEELLEEVRSLMEQHTGDSRL